MAVIKSDTVAQADWEYRQGNVLEQTFLFEPPTGSDFTLVGAKPYIVVADNKCKQVLVTLTEDNGITIDAVNKTISVYALASELSVLSPNRSLYDYELYVTYNNDTEKFSYLQGSFVVLQSLTTYPLAINA